MLTILFLYFLAFTEHWGWGGVTFTCLCNLGALLQQQLTVYTPLIKGGKECRKKYFNEFFKNPRLTISTFYHVKIKVSKVAELRIREFDVANFERSFRMSRIPFVVFDWGLPCMTWCFSSVLKRSLSLIIGAGRGAIRKPLLPFLATHGSGVAALIEFFFKNSFWVSMLSHCCSSICRSCFGWLTRILLLFELK